MTALTCHSKRFVPGCRQPHGLVASLAAALLVVVVAGCAETRSAVAERSVATPGLRSTAAPSNSPPAPTVRIGIGPHRLAESDGTVWVSTDIGDVVGVDADSATVTHRITTGTLLSGIAVVNGRVWAAANRDGLLLEIDPDTDTVAGQVVVGEGPRGVTAVGSQLWVAVGRLGRLVRVDPATRAVSGSTPAGPSPAQIVSTAQGLWVTDRDNAAVVLADPDGGPVLASVDVGGPTIGVAADERSVWVCRSDVGEVVRIDQGTRAVAARTDLPSVCYGAALADGALWVGGADGVLRRLDRESLSVQGTARVGGAPVGVSQVGVEVWTADSEDGTVSRVTIASVG